jgi:hypothetical protein
MKSMPYTSGEVFLSSSIRFFFFSLGKVSWRVGPTEDTSHFAHGASAHGCDMLERWARPRGIRWLAGGIAAVVLALAVAWVLFVPTAAWRRTMTSARRTERCSRRRGTLPEAAC